MDSYKGLTWAEKKKLHKRRNYLCQKINEKGITQLLKKGISDFYLAWYWSEISTFGSLKLDHNWKVFRASYDVDTLVEICLMSVTIYLYGGKLGDQCRKDDIFALVLQMKDKNIKRY